MTIWHDAFKKPHDACTFNQFYVFNSVMCGCFYCHEIYSAKAVVTFVRTKEGMPKTAVCPRCKVDCVLPDASGYPVEKSFIQIQGGYWFQNINKNIVGQDYWLTQLKKAGYL